MIDGSTTPMENDLRRARDELELRVAERTRELAQAVRVRDEFLSIASHELKTPLTALRLRAQLRERALQTSGTDYFTADRIRQMVETDLKDIGRIIHLVDNMLDITRLQAGKLRLEKEPLDLSALVREVIQRFERQIMASGSSIRIEAPEPVQGRWDRYRIEQVFTNLLTNAVKYGAGNPISVAVWGTPEGGHLRVSDGGIGIAAEDQLRIFRQFERATGEDSGTTGLGLGLYIVRQIVESHGGKITVQSESGRGSSFTVELPYE